MSLKASEETVINFIGISTGGVKVELKLRILFGVKQAAHMGINPDPAIAIAAPDQVYMTIPKLVCINPFKRR